MFTNLISTHQLASHLDDPDWVIVDCRFDLTNPDWGQEDYQQAHIPGAVYAHLDRDLSSPITPQTGRHPLPAPEQFRQKLETWGIQTNTQVVVYDTTGGGFAGRLWWLLRYFDHNAVALLNGGLPQWERDGYPVRGGVETRQPVKRDDPITFHPEMLVDAEEVERIREDPQFRLIDARAPERFRGEVEPLDTVAGHIPGAVNRFHGENLSAEGTLKSIDELRREFEQLLGGVTPENTVMYCGSGVTSCHHLIALDALGISGARLYAGSWSEWIRNPDRPVG